MAWPGVNALQFGFVVEVEIRSLWQLRVNLASAVRRRTGFVRAGPSCRWVAVLGVLRWHERCYGATSVERN